MKINEVLFTTEATDKLCREIAEKSHKVCFLMLSRGKDSLCAWLQVRKYFDRVIPFHCATIPGYTYVGEYLDYLEDALDSRILRLMGEDLKMSLVRHIYQETPWECDEIDRVFPDQDYSKLDILDYLRMKFNLPRAWCAVGISKNDSIDRLIYCRKNGGKNVTNRTFYPCWDWPREELLDAIWNSGLYLAPEYKYSKRSIGGVPGATYNNILKEHFPRDWELTKKWYPLAEVKNYREEMIEANYDLWMKQEAAKRGGRISEGEVDGSADGLLDEEVEGAETEEVTDSALEDKPLSISSVKDEIEDGESEVEEDAET